MAKARSKKESEISAFLKHTTDAKASVLIRFHKLNVKDERLLRSQLRAVGCELQVIKKTLLIKALASMELDLNAVGDTTGSFAIVYGMTDEVSPAKTLVQFAKKVDAVSIVAGIYAKAIIQKQQVLALASLPTREQLLAQLCNLLQSPLSRLVRSVAAPMQGFVSVLKARQEKLS